MEDKRNSSSPQKEERFERAHLEWPVQAFKLEVLLTLSLMIYFFLSDSRHPWGYSLQSHRWTRVMCHLPPLPRSNTYRGGSGRYSSSVPIAVKLTRLEKLRWAGPSWGVWERVQAAPQCALSQESPPARNQPPSLPVQVDLWILPSILQKLTGP